MTEIDCLIQARWVVPVEPADTVLENWSIAVQAGRIAELLPTSQAERKYPAAERCRRHTHIAIPGLINTHTEAAASLLRGLANDMPLDEWQQRHILPAEKRWVSQEFVRDGAELSIAEMLRGGTTCINDMYWLPNILAHAAAQHGIRASVGIVVSDQPTPWTGSTDDCLAKGIALHDDYLQHPLITANFSVPRPGDVSDKTLLRVRRLSDELELPVVIRLHQSAEAVEQSLITAGRRPFARLQGLGLVNPALVAVHMTQLNGDEIAAIAHCGAHVVHCPETNLKLATGSCPVTRLLAAGANVALGTGGAHGNGDQNLLGAMRTAALLAKGLSRDATSLPAHTALRMATLNGARALGLESCTGSLEAGKSADIVCVDLDDLRTQPVYDAVAQLVYAAGRNQVSDVWVAGRRVLAEGLLTTIDEAGVIDRARRWSANIGAIAKP